MPQHFFLPQSKIAFTIIPKTGCTTLKNYLIGIEESLSSDQPSNHEIDYRGLSIHESLTDYKFRVGKVISSKEQAISRVLVLRNPYSRALSAWVNKFLYAQGDFTIFQRLLNESFTPVDFHTVADLNASFEDFLDRLSRDEEFLQSDKHWRPQSSFIGNLNNYNIVLETSSLATLQEKLSDRTDLSDLLENRPVPKFNSTNDLILSLMGTEKAWELIEKTYAGDFELLKQAGFSQIRKPIVSTLSQTEADQVLLVEKPAILASRMSSELLKLRAELSTLQTSRSWRYTAWLRTLGRLVEKQP